MYGQNAQNPFPQYNYIYLTEDMGLAHNFVDDLCKDSQGYIWIATHNGLTRYDGYNFLNFTSDTTPITLKSNFVHKICEDNFNRLWVASEEGIDIIDLERYTHVDFGLEEYSPLWNLMHSYTYSICKDNRGDLWISSGNTLCCIELDAGGLISDYYFLEEGASRAPVNAVIDVGWSVCAGINNVVQRIDKRKEHLLKAEPVSQLVMALYDDWKIHCMEVDGELLWIGTNRGLFKYDHFEQKIERYRYSSTRPGMLSQSHITDIKRDRNGHLFVSTLNGLNYYNRDDNTFVFIRQNNDNRLKSLNCNFINCLLPDGDNLWVGTEIGGVNLLAQGRLSAYTWQYEKTNPSSLSPNPVNAICEDRQGNLWIGTVEGGLNLMRKGESTFEHFVSTPDDPSTLSHNSVCGILLDSDNHLWAYTWGLGVNELDLNIPGNRRFKRYYKGQTENMEGNFVASACEDTINKGIWFGTTEGLHFFDKLKQQFVQVKFGMSDNTFDTMAALCMDRRNRLWVGTSRGLFIIDIFSFARSRIHFDYVHIKTKLSDSGSSTTDKINCIIQDGEERIWLGCNGSGMYEFTGHKDGLFQFKNYTVKDGLPNDNVIGIAEDDNGRLWLSTSQGISRLDKQSMAFTNYTKHDGLLTNQFYWNAYYYSKARNLLFFGNTEGLVAIRPDMNEESYNPAKVSLTNLSILGNTVYPSTGRHIDREISKAQQIRLHESDKVFNIDFSAKDYGRTGQERYAYRLKGYDEAWNEPAIGEHTARYTSLPSGNYTFQVRAIDNRGRWSDEVTEIKVSVTPYFYKSWWFFTILLVLAVAGLRRFYAWKTKNYRLSFFTSITHEFRTPVTLIHGPLEQALKANKDPGIAEQLQMAERNSRYLLALVNELMDFRKIDADKVQLTPKSGNFREFMERELVSFKVFARERNIRFKLYSRLANEYLVFDYEYLRKVVINLLSNAVKFTPNDGTIQVYIASLRGDGGKRLIYIGVRDSGAGVAKEDMEKIFDRFYQSRKSVKYPVQGQSSTGIGLFLCKKIVRLHGGTIQVCNNKGEGATFRVLLPCVAGEQSEALALKEKEVRPGEALSSPGNASETILVVDDNADMRSYIRSLLSPNYMILEAGDGAKALSIIRSTHLDLIVSDLMMPVMDGVELSRRVKENLSTSHIPFLMLTAIVSEEQKKMSYRIGVDEYLCKPFDEDILLLRIRNIFAQREKYRLRFAVSMNCETLNINEESRDKKFMTAALNLMKKHVGDCDYEVDDFVSDLGYSKTLVNTKLHELAGQSIGQFMRNYRLNTAHEILTNMPADAGMNIAEVAYAVGFNDPKYFTRCFREFFGVLPSVVLAGRK